MMTPLRQRMLEELQRRNYSDFLCHQPKKVHRENLISREPDTCPWHSCHLLRSSKAPSVAASPLHRGHRKKSAQS
jgi:hypothetical protein